MAHSKTTSAANQTSIRAFGQGAKPNASSGVVLGSNAHSAGGSSTGAFIVSPVGRSQAFVDKLPTADRTVGATRDKDPATSVACGSRTANPHRSTHSSFQRSTSTATSSGYSKTSPVVTAARCSDTTSRSASTAASTAPC